MRKTAVWFDPGQYAWRVHSREDGADRLDMGPCYLDQAMADDAGAFWVEWGYWPSPEIVASMDQRSHTVRAMTEHYALDLD